MPKFRHVDGNTWEGDATIGPKQSTDEQSHPVAVRFTVAMPKPKSWPDEEFEHYLYDYFLKATSAAKAKSPHYAGPPTLTEEQKAVNKVVAKANREEKKAQNARNAQIADVAKASGLTDEQIKDALTAYAKEQQA